MRKRKAYFGAARRRNKRHWPGLLTRYFSGGLRRHFDKATKQLSFSETWYPTVTVPFTEEKDGV